MSNKDKDINNDLDTDFSEFEEESLDENQTNSEKDEVLESSDDFEFTNDFDMDESVKSNENSDPAFDDFVFDDETTNVNNEDSNEDSEVLDSTEFEFEEPILNDDNIPVLSDVVEDDVFEEPSFEAVEDNDPFNFDEDYKEETKAEVVNDLNEEDPFGPDSKFDFIEETPDTEDDWLNDNISASEVTNESKSEVEEADVDDLFIDDNINETNEFEEIKDEETSLTSVESTIEKDFFEEPFEEELISDKLDEPVHIAHNDFNDDNDKKEPAIMANKDDEFEFEDDFDLNQDDTNLNNNDDDFEFENDFDLNKEEIDTNFSFDDEPQSEEAEEDFDFKNESEEEEIEENNTVNEASNTATEEDPKEKSKSNIFKYTLIAAAVMLLGGGGFAYLELTAPSYDDEEEEVAQEQVVQKPKKVVKKEVKEEPKVEDISQELDSLNVIPEATKPAKIKEVENFESRTPTPSANSNSNSNVSAAQVKDLQSQLNGLVGSLSGLKQELQEVNEKNKRLERLVQEAKDNTNTKGLENFQLEFNNLRNDMNIIKQTVENEKESTKDTMIKFLTISKRLKEEIESLKSSQLDKDEIENKLKQIDSLNSQLAVLNTKMSNTEVLTKISSLEKQMTEQKLADMEKQVGKTQQQVKESSKSGKKSVLELLEEKNKKNNESVVEQEEQLTVPLSVVIEEDSVAERPVAKKQVIKAKPNYNYYFVGTIEGVVYLKNSAGSIVDYREGDRLPGYGQILKIYNDGSIETENGNVKFSDK